jgi:hypothetical protein
MHQSGDLVQIETAPGKGTTVRLCLPFYKLNPKERFAAPANGKTLLLWVVNTMCAACWPTSCATWATAS